ncbi:hypothetical protein HanIR_Chr02g0093441 [Helianthus annuus]|nr:hypothetical protein HanIR_Chr02g0093441 [Helianthus annuus]
MLAERLGCPIGQPSRTDYTSRSTGLTDRLAPGPTNSPSVVLTRKWCSIDYATRLNITTRIMRYYTSTLNLFETLECHPIEHATRSSDMLPFNYTKVSNRSVGLTDRTTRSIDRLER